MNGSMVDLTDLTLKPKHSMPNSWSVMALDNSQMDLFVEIALP